MHYDFETVIMRRGTDSVKWDVAENELPMWVADMDFKAAPEILEAIRERLDHGIMGYPVIPQRWYEAYINWWDMRHGLKMNSDHLFFSTGVIPAISSMIRAFTAPGGNVLIQPPVYNAFFNIIKANGRRVKENPMIYKDGAYETDLEDLEKKLSDPDTKLMILCNPHNPAGIIWEKDVLNAVGELAKKHGVIVISDEIHCDITEPGCSYTPFATAGCDCNEIGITFIAPTKAFNLAGLKTAAVYAEDDTIRDKVRKALETDELTEASSFAATAAIAAFEKGGEWLDELRQVISDNRKTAEEFIASRIPDIKIVKGYATYLMWLDVSALTEGIEDFGDFLRQKTGLFLSSGSIFGDQGRNFLRMNVACPKSLLMDGLERLEKGSHKSAHGK